jgi:hypothetical protein
MGSSLPSLPQLLPSPEDHGEKRVRVPHPVRAQQERPASQVCAPQQRDVVCRTDSDGGGTALPRCLHRCHGTSGHGAVRCHSTCGRGTVPMMQQVGGRGFELPVLLVIAADVSVGHGGRLCLCCAGYLFFVSYEQSAPMCVLLRIPMQ